MNFRFGYYASKWKRPSSIDNSFTTTNLGSPVIFETEFKSQGAFGSVDFVSKLSEQSSIHASAFLKLGVSNNISTSLRDFNSVLEANTKLKYHSAGINIFYKYKLWNDVQGRAFYISPGATYDYRDWRVGSETADFDSLPSINRERLWRLYANVEFQF